MEAIQGKTVATAAAGGTDETGQNRVVEKGVQGFL
jgi:hypothetical protein